VELGLAGRAAIVTGASRGIGRAITDALVAEGCRVLACARDVAPIEDLTAGGDVLAVTADVTADATAEHLVEECRRAFGRLDVVVNNAGHAEPAAIDRLAAGAWQDALDVHVLAAARLSVAAAGVMRAAGWGRLVHVSSVHGREPDPLFAPYSAAKAALLNLSTSLSRAFAGDGVTSNCVVPGVTVTELVEANAAATAERTGTTAEEVLARLLAKQGVAAGRFGRPREVADAVVFLASERASWITGATLEVDGGTLRSA
jgi:NAD(P)-dependent dehydrogenase (short-subunit alcohol dehydrogenase family)